MKTSRPLLVQFGAGNIGRSLVGPIFTAGGYDVLFVDADAAVVEALHQRRRYRVVIKDDLLAGAPDAIEVEHVDGLNVRDAAAVAAAVREADLLGTAVGANVLPAVMAALAPGLLQRTRPVSILLSENLHDAPGLCRAALRSKLPADFDLPTRVGLVATSIGKMVPILPAEVRARDPLEVWGEAYSAIVADRLAFLGPAPAVAGLELHDCFEAYVERKLYVHNLGHAACACLGFLRRCRLIAEAMDVPEVAAETAAVMLTTARGLTIRYPASFAMADQEAHVSDLLRRFRNRSLGDTVYRVGRDLGRKLGPRDRFIGGLRLVKETGGDPAPLCRAIAAAMHFAAGDEHGGHFEPDAAVRTAVRSDGVERFLERHAGLDPVAFGAELAIIREAYAAFAPPEPKSGWAGS